MDLLSICYLADFRGLFCLSPAWRDRQAWRDTLRPSWFEPRHQ